MSATDLVLLKCGLAVPLGAVELALDLERRGLELWVEDGYICVGPPARLTDEDRQAIQQWKPALVTLLAYIENNGTVQ